MFQNIDGDSFESSLTNNVLTISGNVVSKDEKERVVPIQRWYCLCKIANTTMYRMKGLRPDCITSIRALCVLFLKTISLEKVLFSERFVSSWCDSYFVLFSWSLWTLKINTSLIIVVSSDSITYISWCYSTLMNWFTDQRRNNCTVIEQSFMNGNGHRSIFYASVLEIDNTWIFPTNEEYYQIAC